jgi:hypothetical protein
VRRLGLDESEETRVRSLSIDESEETRVSSLGGDESEEPLDSPITPRLAPPPLIFPPLSANTFQSSDCYILYYI